MSSCNKKISVVILTYNSENHIASCLRSLKKEEVVGEIIIVDNHSEDSTIEVIKKSGIKIRLVINRKNLGFSTGVNVGIKCTKYKNILILNPDTIISRRTLMKLIECQTNNDASIVGGKAVKRNGNVHNSFVKKPDIFTAIFDFTNLRKLVPFDYFHKSHYYLNKRYPTTAIEIDAVSGAFMLVRKDVFNKVGLFDENFFMYLEDIDFCLRAKQCGYKVMFCPESEISHVGGASSKNADNINHQAWSDSRKYYFKKNTSMSSNLIIQPLFLLDDFITNIWRKIKSQKSQ